MEIFELRLPARASITLIVRDDRGFVPSPATMLRKLTRLQAELDSGRAPGGWSLARSSPASGWSISS